MLKIAFLTTLRTNVGDDFVRNGIRAVLDRIGRPYSAFYINKHDATSMCSPCDDEVEKLDDKIRQADLLIQAGGPVYWNLDNGSCSLTSEWHQWFWVERVFRSASPKLLNLGVGTCQPYEAEESSFLVNAGCVAFARELEKRSDLTTVRDPLASRILEALDCRHLPIACPAFLAAERAPRLARQPSLIAVNWMRLGAHYDLDGGFPVDRWRSAIEVINAGLRKMGRILFVAHDAAETTFLETFVAPGERVFHASDWREYLDIYGSCNLIVANRVHAATVGAGFGVPSIILGNDSRARIGDFINIPRLRSGFVDPQEVLALASRMISERKAVTDELLEMRGQVISGFVEAVAPHLPPQ